MPLTSLTRDAVTEHFVYGFSAFTDIIDRIPVIVSLAFIFISLSNTQNKDGVAGWLVHIATGGRTGSTARCGMKDFAGEV